MSYQERNTIANLISSIIVFGLYGMYMFNMYQEGRFDGAGAAALVGKSIFVLICASILVTIAVSILFNIFYAIITKEKVQSVTDERDKLIELKGMQVSFIAFGVGFVGSMGALALGIAPFMVFLFIMYSMFFGNGLGEIIKLYLYRRGV
ncbi:MAG: hypothetical protein ABUK01_00370 [Leptospirales bacterium]